MFAQRPPPILKCNWIIFLWARFGCRKHHLLKYGVWVLFSLGTTQNFPSQFNKYCIIYKWNIFSHNCFIYLQRWNWITAPNLNCFIGKFISRIYNAIIVCNKTVCKAINNFSSFHWFRHLSLNEFLKKKSERACFVCGRGTIHSIFRAVEKKISAAKRTENGQIFH